ncbi:hypothetical protein HXX76_004212 [Chlamydomonas incerta]|uniref:CASTOR/POLLUX/SYM8 ion channel conserved domain-containing protein n=1 Tax=Chlamydomonas incerta TaxID=51695 RepID=A0A835W7D2_CHLIN|nr:hypothetical protein HXX76_004212 [Chlamydomonas incerta]|eukprot:KAG2440098.1 hypothetical protein HXX76_004212 [Chlamydomonas incerta]
MRVRTLSSSADGPSSPAPGTSTSTSNGVNSNPSGQGDITGNGPVSTKGHGGDAGPTADAISAAREAQRAAYGAATVAAVNATVVGSWASAVPAGARPVPQVAWSQATNGINSVRGRPHSLREAWRAWLARVTQLIQYRLMMIFRMPTWGKMLSLIIVGLPIVVVGSVLLRQATNLSWYEALQYAFYVLQNVPGMDITRFDQVQARVVLIVIHLMSLYTFATMVGLLTEDVRMTVEEIRSGNFPIPARDHTVLLDPTDDPQHLIAVLKQVLAARESRGQGVYAGCVAVLSSQPKDKMDKLIADSLPQRAASIIVTRHGSCMKVTDLERVAAGAARTVLLLTPSGPVGALTPTMQQELSLTALRSLQPQPPPLTSASDINQAAAEMAAGRAGRGDRDAAWSSDSDSSTGSSSGSGSSGSSNCAGEEDGMWRWLFGAPGDSMDEDVRRQPPEQGRRRPRRRVRPHRQQRVVVETITAEGSAAAACQVVDSDPDLEPLQVTYVSSASSAYRVVVQCAVQPGLAAVFDTIFCREQDASLHITPLPVHLAGRTFGDARRQFRFATLCGIVPGSSSSSSSSAGGAGESSDSGTGSDSENEAAAAASAPAGGPGSAASAAPAASGATAATAAKAAGGASAATPSSGYTAPFNFNLKKVLGLAGDRGNSSSSSSSSGSSGSSSNSGNYGGQSGLVLFAPPDDRVLQRRDQLVLLAHRQKDCCASLLNHLPPQPPQLTTPYDVRRAMPRSIVLLEHNSRLEKSMVAALEEFCAPGCQVIILSPQPCEGLPEGPTARADLRFRNEVGDPMSPAALLQADVLAADAVIISGGYQLPEVESDALVMGTALVLQRLLADPSDGGRAWQQQGRRARQLQLPNKPLTFVCTLHDPQNRSVLQHIAATACRTAIATVAAAVSAYRPPAAAAGPAAAATAAAAYSFAMPSSMPENVDPTFSVDFPSAGYPMQRPSGASSGSSSSSDSVDGDGNSYSSGSSDANGYSSSSGSAHGAGGAAMGAAARGMTIEIVEPGALISGMMAQVGADPRLVSGLEDLLDEQGCEVYIKRPDRYGLKPLDRFTWGQR